MQGFVTIATGDEHYYKLALNLLRSYKMCSKKKYRFAIIADKKNEYTKEFDDVVILSAAKKSWMDKLELLKICPYDENIFIDADCLIYQDINFFWDLFCNADDFSCFGKVLPIDSNEGWFTKEVKDIYPIHFVTHLHGMLYFIRKSNNVDKMYKLCKEIINNYHNFTFKAFNEVIADEPVLALAMAIMNLKPIERKSHYYCFVPFATKIKTNFKRKYVWFHNEKDGYVNNCCIVHWGNKNTLLPQYKNDEYVLNFYYEKSNDLIKKLIGLFLFDLKVYQVYLLIIYSFTRMLSIIKWVIERILIKINSVKF